MTHRALLCLLLLAALAACDDEAPTPSVAEVEPGACGMTLPGVGTWTVAQYADGYLVDTNREVALRTAADGQSWWHRLDGTAGGPVTLGAPYPQGQRVDLYGTEYVVVRGMTDDFSSRSRLIRLADDRILHEFEWRFEGRGEWVITGNTRRDGVPNPRLRSLKTGKSFELPCLLCEFVALDGFGRAWIESQRGELIEVQLATGRVTEHPEFDAYRAEMAGAGLRVGVGEGTVLFGAHPEPVTACAFNGIIAPTGEIACPNDDGLAVLDSTGRALRSVSEPGGRWRVQVLGETFIARTGDQVFWIPFDPARPIERIAGSLSASTSSAVLVRELNSNSGFVLHADGRKLALDFGGNNRPELSANGRRALIRRDTDLAVVDLDTGAVRASVPFDSGQLRFVGSVLVRQGAPLGEAPPSNLSHVLQPDARCPVMLYEQCVGGECDLLIRQFAEPEPEDSSMNQDG